jgi:hypothetical protein
MPSEEALEPCEDILRSSVMFWKGNIPFMDPATSKLAFPIPKAGPSALLDPTRNMDPTSFCSETSLSTGENQARRMARLEHAVGRNQTRRSIRLTEQGK